MRNSLFSNIAAFWIHGNDSLQVKGEETTSGQAKVELCPSPGFSGPIASHGP